MQSFCGIRQLSLTISRMCSKPQISVIQFTATNNKVENLKIIKELVEKSKAKSAQMVFLPEACDFISKNKQELVELSEPIDGPLMTSYKELAVKHDLWISVGGFHEKSSEGPLYNSHIIINNKGEIQCIYRKIHLFDVSIPDKNIHLRESDNNLAGAQLLAPIQSPVGRLGLAICYDLRFPEQSTLMRKFGADILTFPSAFTSSTGKAHWETLLKARAIENQCYVIAAAQYGKHNEKRISYGHSMVVDPWGQIVGECPKYSEEAPHINESFAVVTIDLDLVQKVRTEMPVFSHRRNDLYNLNLIKTPESIDDEKCYSFADKLIPGKTVFCVSKYCFAFTNIRCVVPGHVLVSSLRPTKRLHDLTQEEIADLFQLTVNVSRIMETVHNAGSSTVCIQDGPSAGQTIPHVHAHVLPRKEGDFLNNDDIYTHLARHDKDGTSQDPIRNLNEQIAEATLLRKYFYS
ncbi:hypothetical protein ABEB36_004489 [Hypothenemus hampei]|uniref:Nitrilase and fragile histidine triad fusion protein NitFhit n=1 Tax=Hypothenemus hampei TaxID=57062 RepID=A0ABD1F3I6_HYPHA